MHVFGFSPVFVFLWHSQSLVQNFVFEEFLLCIFWNVHVFGETVVAHPSRLCEPKRILFAMLSALAAHKIL